MIQNGMICPQMMSTIAEFCKGGKDLKHLPIACYIVSSFVYCYSYVCVYCTFNGKLRITLGITGEYWEIGEFNQKPKEHNRLVPIYLRCPTIDLPLANSSYFL